MQERRQNHDRSSSVLVGAGNVNAVGARVGHSVDSMSSLAFPSIHSADEISLVAVKSVAIVVDITDVE